MYKYCIVFFADTKEIIMAWFNILKYPRFASKVYNTYRKSGSNGNPGLIHQGKEIYKLHKLNLLEPEEYQFYQLYKTDLPWEEKQKFLSHNQYCLMETNLNPRKDVGVMNKMVFSCFGRFLGLPVPEMYGIFEANFGYTLDGDDLRTAADLERFFHKYDETDFLIKPIGGAKGIGITKCRADGNSQVKIYGEGTIATTELFNRLRDTGYCKSKYVPDTYIVEKAVKQHPFLDNFCNTSTQTIRVVTFIDSTGRIEILTTHLKMARKGSIVDNVIISNLAAHIDEDGVLDCAITTLDNEIIKYENHPDTGYPVKGQKIPYFKEAVELAIKAQTRVHHLRTIGWDIAISDKGPVIIEGNYGWDHSTIQRITRRGLIKGSFEVELRKMMAGR